MWKSGEITTVTERQFDHAVVLEVTGPRTGRKAPAEIDGVVRRHARAGTRAVVVNLAAVPMIDLAGLGALVDAYITMQRSGGTLRLACMTRRVQELVIITRLITVFDTFESVEKALGAPASGSRDDVQPAPRLSTMSLAPIERFLRTA